MTGERRGKRPRSRSPQRSSRTEPSSSSSSKSRSVSVKDKEPKKPENKLSKILQGNVKIPQNAALLAEPETSKKSVKTKLELFNVLLVWKVGI